MAFDIVNKDGDQLDPRSNSSETKEGTRECTITEDEYADKDGVEIVYTKVIGDAVHRNLWRVLSYMGVAQ